MDVLIINSDNVLEIPSLTNGIDGTAVNGATVQLTLYDSNDVEIAGQAWPIALAYEAGTLGTYRATLAYTLPLTHKQTVKAKVVADAGAGLHREWIKPFRVITGAD